MHTYKHFTGNPATFSIGLRDKCRHLTSLPEFFTPLTQPKIISLLPEMSLSFLSLFQIGRGNKNTACAKGKSMGSVFLTFSIQQVLVHFF